MIKKILLALFLISCVSPCSAYIIFGKGVVENVTSQLVPEGRQGHVLAMYKDMLKAKRGKGVATKDLQNLCGAAGWDIKKADGKSKCETYVRTLIKLSTVDLNHKVCQTIPDRREHSDRCIEIFKNLTVNLIQAQGLADLYARSVGDRVICADKVYVTREYNNIHGSKLHYLKCVSRDYNIFYEFPFWNTDGNIDKDNHQNFLQGVCKVAHGEYTSKKYDSKNTFKICAGLTKSKCNELNTVLTEKGLGYNTNWGPWFAISEKGYMINGDKFPYCLIQTALTFSKDGTVYEHNVLGLDQRYFLTNDAQIKGDKFIVEHIYKYVKSRVGNLTSFYCGQDYQTVKLKGRSGKDDAVICYVNGNIVPFFFDDLSERWKIYDKGGRQGLECLAWGGEFTGKKCMGLDEKMCNTVRDANKESCPECETIKWNPKTNVCELPSSESARSLKNGLRYTAIVGGMLATIVVTIGTFGSGTLPTMLVWISATVEVSGGYIELVSQISIDNTPDEFFTDAANCNNAKCAEELLLKYFKRLANQQNDMSDSELRAADSVLARLADLIPAESEFYQTMFANGTDLASNNTGEWTSDQVWRAVGIGLQFFSIGVDILNWVLKKAVTLQKFTPKVEQIFRKKAMQAADWRTRQSAILANAAKVAKENAVDVNKLDDVGKEWYELWKKYAPKDQTFEEFKAITNGDLDKMKKMTQQNFVGRGDNAIREQKIQQLGIDQLDLIADRAELDEQLNLLLKQYDLKISDIPNRDLLYDKYYKQYKNIDKAIEESRKEYDEFFKPYPGLKDTYDKFIQTDLSYKSAYAMEEFLNTGNTFYSTYDPEFTKFAQDYTKRYQDVRKWFDSEFEKKVKNYYRTHDVAEEYIKTPEYNALWNEYIKRIDKVVSDYQFNVAQRFPVKNLANIVDEREAQWRMVFDADPEFANTLKHWGTYTNKERIKMLQDMQHKFADQTGTPAAGLSFNADMTRGAAQYNQETGGIEFKPRTVNLIMEPEATLSHEVMHKIDWEMPNEGVLGEQKATMNQLYSSKPQHGYRIALTEQGAYKMTDRFGTGGSSFDEDIFSNTQLLNPKLIYKGSIIGLGVGETGALIKHTIDELEKDKKQDQLLKK